MAGTATGSRRRAAAAIGLTEDEYNRRREAGEKWCFRCTAWHLAAAFGKDASRDDGLSASCLASRRVVVRKDMRGIARRVGWLKRFRDGDKLQARARVNYLIAKGRIPEPNSVPCKDCGHAWSEGSRRHEYDHHMGYASAHQLDVEAVCSTCHRRRTAERGELVQQRDVRGRFSQKTEACHG